MKDKLIQITLAVALGLVIIFSISQCRRANDNAHDAQTLFADAKQEQINHRDELGRLTTTTKSQEIVNQDLLNELAERELEVEKLKGKVKSITNVTRTIVRRDTTFEVQIIPGRDSIINDTIYKFPTYVSHFGDKWYKLDIRANDFSTEHSLTLFEDFNVVMTKRNKLFKKDYIDVLVKSSNPHVEDQSIKSFSKEDKPQKWNISAQVGLGLNKSLEISPYVGVGLGYSILQW